MKIPVANATVCITPEENSKDTLCSAKTNKYGDFEIPVPDSEVNYNLRVMPEDKSVSDIILASQEGQEISLLQIHEDCFDYKIIPTDIFRLSDMLEQEELAMVFGNFVSRQDRELIRVENINYTKGSYSIKEDSKKTLDKVAQILTKNPNIRLEVISHTDAQGDDQSNMELSEKRSLAVVSYLILIGVHKDRLNYTGKGETEIRNRCKNNVDCSDTEHRYNRRTEFKFFKE